MSSSTSSTSSSINAKLKSYITVENQPTSNSETELSVALNKESEEFITWLQEPSASEVERLVKARRVTKESQIKPIKTNLRYIYSIIVQHHICTKDFVSLSVFSQLETCKILFKALEKRQSGPARVHTVFLLVKKIIVYLSTKESLRLKEYRPPTLMSSYHYVTAICSEFTTQRKSLTADRSLLGRSHLEVPASLVQESSPRLSCSEPMTKMELQTLIADV